MEVPDCPWARSALAATLSGEAASIDVRAAGSEAGGTVGTGPPGNWTRLAGIWGAAVAWHSPPLIQLFPPPAQQGSRHHLGVKCFFPVGGLALCAQSSRAIIIKPAAHIFHVFFFFFPVYLPLSLYRALSFSVCLTVGAHICRFLSLSLSVVVYRPQV